MPQKQLDVTSPFTTREFRAAGFDAGRLRTKEFKPVFRDAYIAAYVAITQHVMMQAALKLAGPEAHVSHFTAAEFYDLAPPDHAGIDVSTPAGVTRSRTDGISAHQRSRRAVVVDCNSIRLSSPIQTFLDLAGHPGVTLVDLTIVGDRIVRKQLATPAELIAAADAWKGKGARLARRVARLVRRGVDSPMETRLRLLIVLAGLPEPNVNEILRHANGDWWLRLDLSYLKYKVLIEYDGRQHAESNKQWRKDISRREQLEKWKWRTVTVTAEGIFDDPEDTLRRVVEVLRERGVPGVPGRLNDEWRRHFVPRLGRRN